MPSFERSIGSQDDEPTVDTLIQVFDAIEEILGRPDVNNQANAGRRAIRLSGRRSSLLVGSHEHDAKETEVERQPDYYISFLAADRQITDYEFYITESGIRLERFISVSDPHQGPDSEEDSQGIYGHEETERRYGLHTVSEGDAQNALLLLDTYKHAPKSSN